MFIGEVMGTVVATRKTDNMEGLSLRLVRKLNIDTTPTTTFLVAVDVLGADDGELVLITSGSPARQTKPTDNRPVDAIIMAIVDTWQANGAVLFSKAAGSAGWQQNLAGCVAGNRLYSTPHTR